MILDPFEQILKLELAEGAIMRKRVVPYGRKIKANASMHEAMNWMRLPAECLNIRVNTEQRATHHYLSIYQDHRGFTNGKR